MGWVRRAVSVAVGAIVMSVGLTAPAQAAGAPTCTNVYLSPHQDDEVLSMGAAIRRDVERFGPASVCVALFTTGQHSAVRSRFAAPGFVPAGRSTPYVNATVAKSPTAFGKARDREFVAALRALGVPAANIHLDNLPGWKRVFDWNDEEHGDRIAGNAARFVDAAIRRFGARAAYATMSEHDPSADHRALGAALLERADRVRDVRLYYPQFQRSLLDPDVRLVAETARNPAAVRAAAAQYGLFEPAAGRYGIGWLSVSRAFGGGAFGVKVWGLGAWHAATPFGASLDTSLLSTLRSYRQS